MVINLLCAIYYLYAKQKVEKKYIKILKVMGEPFKCLFPSMFQN